MPLFFRKKEKKLEEKKVKQEEEKEIKIEKPVEAPKVKKEIKIGEAYRLLKAPHVTEKATALSEKNQYAFKVLPKTNKAEIKRAVEDLYGVNVLSVKIIKAPKKRRRLGRISGWRKGYKKAIVRIKEGQKIEVLPR